MVEILTSFFVFCFGLFVGSFLNCVIYRLEKSESFLKGRSYCPYCKHILSWQDLIPIFSFIFLRGKCRYCQKPISWQYPLVELATGILFVFTLIYFFPKTSILLNSAMTELTSIYYLVIVCFLIVIFVYDLKHYIIPDQVIYPAIVLAFLYNIYQFAINNQQLTINNFLFAFGAAAFFLTIVLISRGKWMGVGDIKLAFLMGLFLGFPDILVALFLAFLIGAAVGLILIALGKKTLKSEVPFAPFLVTGTFLAMFFGQKLIDTYLNLFLLK
jgi:prepilin signal peptidase PulO-like enzyme (type II secretory pathway)